MGTSLGSIFIDLKINLKALDAANRKIKNFSKTITVQTKKASTAVKRMERSWRKSMRRMSNDAFRLGGILTASLTGGLVRVFKSVVGGAAFDELEFIKLRKLLPVTEERAQELRQELRELSRRVPLASAAISNVGAEAARLGVAERYISSFTEVMGKMSFATVLGSKDAATALARFSNIVKLPLDQIERVGSAVVHLGNNFAANEKEITKMALRIGSLKAVAGATIPQILGLSAAFPAVGLFPELVGTSMTRIMIKLQTGIKQSKDVLGLVSALSEKEPEQFKEDFYKDQIGGLLDLAEGLKKGTNSGINFAEMLKAIGLDGHRITLVMAFLSENTELFRDALDKSAEAFERNIHLEREFQRFMNTLTNQFALLKNQLNIVKLNLGTQFLPIFRRVVKEFLSNVVPALEVLVTYLGKLSTKTRVFIIVFTVLLAVLGPTILALGILAKVLLILGGTIGIVMIAALAIPIALIAMVIWWDKVTVAVYRFKMMILATWDRIKGFFGDLRDNFVRDMKQLWLDIGKIWTDMTDWMGDAWKNAIDKMTFGNLDRLTSFSNRIRSIFGGTKVELDDFTKGAGGDDGMFAHGPLQQAIRRQKFLNELKKKIPMISDEEVKKLRNAEDIFKAVVELDKKHEWGKGLTDTYNQFYKDFKKQQAKNLKEVEKRSKLDPFDPKANQNLAKLEAKWAELAAMLTDKANTTGEKAGKTFSETFLDTIESNLSGRLESLFKGELGSLADWFKVLTDAMANTWAKFLAEDIVGSLNNAMKKSGASGFLDSLFQAVSSTNFNIGDGSGGIIPQTRFTNDPLGNQIPLNQTPASGSHLPNHIPGMATGGVLVGEEGPEVLMNAVASKRYGSHLAALNAGISGGMGGNQQTINQNFNFEAGVTQGQLGATLSKFSNEMYRKIVEDIKTPGSGFRNAIRGS